MTEIENQNSEGQEVATQVDNPVNEVNEAKKLKEETDERNFKAMRLKNADLEKRLKQFEDMQMQILQAQLANQAPAREEVDEFDSIGSDEFIPKGKVERLVEKKAQQYAEQIAKKEVESYFKKQNDSQYL